MNRQKYLPKSLKHSSYFDGIIKNIFESITNLVENMATIYSYGIITKNKNTFSTNRLLHFPVFGSRHRTPRFALDRRITLCEEINSEKGGKKWSKRG